LWKNIILISQNYTKVKELFEKLVKESRAGNGYVIYRFKLDKEYLDWNERAESLDWIEIDYDGNTTDIKIP
jgi:hypothetical protein